jgi:hypothetical protein
LPRASLDIPLRVRFKLWLTISPFTNTDCLGVVAAAAVPIALPPIKPSIALINILRISFPSSL